MKLGKFKKPETESDLYDYAACLADDYFFGIKLLDQSETEEEKKAIKKQLNDLEKEIDKLPKRVWR